MIVTLPANNYYYANNNYYYRIRTASPAISHGGPGTRKCRGRGRSARARRRARASGPALRDGPEFCSGQKCSEQKVLLRAEISENKIRINGSGPSERRAGVLLGANPPRPGGPVSLSPSLSLSLSLETRRGTRIPRHLPRRLRPTQVRAGLRRPAHPPPPARAPGVGWWWWWGSNLLGETNPRRLAPSTYTRARARARIGAGSLQYGGSRLDRPHPVPPPSLPPLRPSVSPSPAVAGRAGRRRPAPTEAVAFLHGGADDRVGSRAGVRAAWPKSAFAVRRGGGGGGGGGVCGCV